MGSGFWTIRGTCGRPRSVNWSTHKSKVGNLKNGLQGKPPAIQHDVRTRSIWKQLSGRVLADFDFGHNVVNCGAIEPLVSIPGVVAARSSVQPKKTSQAVKPQLPLEDCEGMALKVLV